MFRDENIIFEVDPSTKIKIIGMKKLRCGLCIAEVKEDVYITKCFKCNDFLHFAKDCKKEITCRRCAETGHYERDCTAEEVKCCNCLEANLKFDLNLEVDNIA